MNVLSKKRISPTMKKQIVKEADKYLSEQRRTIETQMQKQFSFMFCLSLAVALDKEFGFGDKRRKKAIDAVIKTANEISDGLCKNKCETAEGKECFDIEYNRETLKRLADYYSIPYDENMFNC